MSRADHSRKLIIGAAVGGVFLLGGAALVVGALVAARQRGDLTAAVPGVDHLAGSAESRRLAAHPWWKGSVGLGNIDGILDAAMSSSSGAVVFDQHGRFVKHDRAFLVGPRDTLEDHIERGRLPPVVREFRGQVKVLGFLRWNTGERMTRQEAANALEDALNSDVATVRTAPAP